MALRVKDAGSSAQKFTTRAQAAAGDYQKGVAAAGDTWATNAAAATDSYQAGVNAAISRGAFQKGIQKAGAGKYSSNASGKGAARYPQGVATAGPNWQNGVSPYLSALASLSLTPRRPKGDPSNLQRVSEIATALRRIKTGGA